MANNHICWVNDIYGVDKEIEEQTTSNIVVVLALYWSEALDRAIVMCNKEFEAFVDLKNALIRLARWTPTPRPTSKLSRRGCVATLIGIRTLVDTVSKTTLWQRRNARASPKLPTAVAVVFRQSWRIVADGLFDEDELTRQ